MKNKLTVLTLTLLLSAMTLSLGGQESARSLKILTLGDSNGALPDGWVNQLQKILPNDTIFNISISGNTIGFNNNGRRSLNTLANISLYMERARKRLVKIDAVIIMIGTNDCKAVFKDSLQLVPENMRKLISRIRKGSGQKRNYPTIYIVSPPPFGPDEMLDIKYKGGMERIDWLNRQLEIVAGEEKVHFIDSCPILFPVFNYLTVDGVHLKADGQMTIARIIKENLKYLHIK